MNLGDILTELLNHNRSERYLVASIIFGFLEIG